MTDWSVRAFSGAEGLAQLEGDWRRLVREMPNPAFHQAFETQLAYATHCIEGPTPPTYLAVSDRASVRAICPLEAGTDRILGGTRRIWRLPLTGINLHCDVVCAPEPSVRSALLPAIIGFLGRTAERRDWLVLDRIADTSIVWQCLQDYRTSRVFTNDVPPMHVIDTTQTTDGMMATRSKQLRTNLRGARKQLATYPNVRFERFTDPAAVCRELETFLVLEASGWKGASGQRTAAIYRPGLLGFIRDIAGMHDTAHCEINALYVGDDCIASQFCLHAGGEYVVFKIAYDERYAVVSPGNVLFEWTLDRCCENPAVRYVNLLNDAAWHLPWKPVPVPMHSAHIALGRWSGHALSALLRLRQQLQGYRRPAVRASAS